jgi:flavin reductase (DIM6/NTAB) family NADH-FMN oxidoreductase RutF
LTEQSQPCALASRHGQHPPSRPIIRGYHATRLRRQQDQTQIEPSDNDALAGAEAQGRSSTADQGVAHNIRSTTGIAEDIPLEVDHVEVEAERLKGDVRQLMRNVPSSVAIITVASYDAELKKNVPMGVAVSSLSTVTLDPPTISFNIKEPSKTLDAIRAAKGLFRVHLPIGDLLGATMVDLFSRGNHPDAYEMRIKQLNLHIPGSPSHESPSFRFRTRHPHSSIPSSRSQAPQILNFSVRAAMECKLTQEISVADHVILVAHIEEMENKKPGDRTILYVDGTYMLPNGSKIGPRKAPTPSTQPAWSILDSPLFPGKEERHAYMEQIKAIVKNQPELLESGDRPFRDLELALPIAPSVWGINLEQIFDECRREAGIPSQLVDHRQHLPVLSDFYGRLPPSDRALIVERAKNLVRADPNALNANFHEFFRLLGVSHASRDLLPSDLAEPLRADGLLGPFVPRTGKPSRISVHHGDFNLQYLEQAERCIVDHLATLRPEATLLTPLAKVLESIGESKHIHTYFRRSQTRLQAAACPSLFDLSKIDIRGEASPEEIRVIMRRLTRFGEANSTRVEKYQSLHMKLHRFRIHPAITGFDYEFFSAKTRQLYLSAQSGSDFVRRVEEMLAPWFDTVITWEELERRVKKFVEKSPTRAMSWSTPDKLAAIGLSWKAVLDLPSPAEKQSLRDGHILNTIVAKELKALHGKAPEDLRQAIASYLKEEYNFNIDQTSDGPSNEETNQHEKIHPAKRPIDLTGRIRYTSGFTNLPDTEQIWDGLTDRRKRRIDRGRKLNLSMTRRTKGQEEGDTG